MTTRKQLIGNLRALGIDKIWGRGLSIRTKAELQEFINAMEAQRDLASGKRFDHLSYSQVSQYLMCGLEYYFKRLDPNAPHFPPDAKMRLGSAYHVGLATGLEDVKRGAPDPPVDLLTDAFAEAFNGDADEVDWTGFDRPRMERQGLAMVELYRDYIMPPLMPTAVEEGFRVTFQNRDWTMFVVPDAEGIDLDDGKSVLIDHKCGAKIADANSARDSEQLSAGALAALGKVGKLPDSLEIHQAVYYKTQPKKKEAFAAISDGTQEVVGIQVIESTRDDRSIRRYLRTMEMVIEGLLVGRFQPASSWAWWCAENQCNYWDYCHEQF
jgi:hypothetical protein